MSPENTLKCLVKTLLNHYGDDFSLEKFTFIVQLSDDVKFVSSIYRCLRYAVETNVKELKLGFCCPHSNYPDSYYNLPQLVFYAKSMSLLGLDSCKLESPRGNVTLSCLRELRPRHVCADDQVIKDLISGCPLIEFISIISCRGLKHLELPNLGKLKEFKVYDEYGLEQVYIQGMNAHSVHIIGLHMLPHISVVPCKNLKKLKLCQGFHYG